MVAHTSELLPATRWPRPVEPATYERVRDAYLDRLFATGQVRAAYQMGGVGAPGLSDLDLLIVCRDPIEGDLNAAADIAGIGDEGRYVFMHSQFLLNEQVFRQQRALFFGSDLRHVRGERIEVDEPVGEVADALRLSFHVEMMVRQLGAFERVRRGHEAPAVRPLLAALHGVRFNIETAAEFVDVSGLEGYVDDVKRLRAEWFELDRAVAYEAVAGLLEKAVETLQELLGRLRPAVLALHPGASYRDEGRVHALEIHEVQRYGPFPAAVRFRNNPLIRALPRALRLRRAVRPHLAPVTEIRVPGEFFVFPALQAQSLRDLEAAGLARRVRGKVADGARPALLEAMEERAAALLEMRSFVARNRLRRLAYLTPSCWQRPYPWQFRMKARILAATGLI